MDWFTLLLSVAGLAFFEIILSVDNAVINASVLKGMSDWARRWFLVWGIFIAVFVVRGVLPWAIVFFSNPSLGIIGSLTATFSSDPQVIHQIESSKPALLSFSGIFLVFLFFHWLFMETKNFGLRGEEFIQRHGLWFYTIASFILLGYTWFAIQINPMMAFGAVAGSTTFFIMHGFKQNAEAKEHELMEGGTRLSDWSKLLYLEVIDASFSIDGVLGAFAFTFSIPLIIVGSGIGAIAVRELTIHNIDRVSKYKYLKNGAMYSVFILGIIMLANAFGAHVPEWQTAVVPFACIGYFYWRSKKEMESEPDEKKVRTEKG
jgi:hypothetical protein